LAYVSSFEPNSGIYRQGAEHHIDHLTGMQPLTPDLESMFDGFLMIMHEFPQLV
jgi:hypothetical protein